MHYLLTVNFEQYEYRSNYTVATIFQYLNKEIIKIIDSCK